MCKKKQNKIFLLFHIFSDVQSTVDNIPLFHINTNNHK